MNCGDKIKLPDFPTKIGVYLDLLLLGSFCVNCTSSEHIYICKTLRMNLMSGQEFKRGVRTIYSLDIHIRTIVHEGPCVMPLA
jgi:hypothetical protein